MNYVIILPIRENCILTVEVTYAASNLVPAMFEYLLHIVKIETIFCDGNDFY
jgi:hypothetical protein